MPKPYNVQKAKWTKVDDVFLDKDQARADDIVIPVMGSTGSGKSTFINNVLEALRSEPQAPVDDAYMTCTSKVAHYLADIPPELFPNVDVQNRRLVLVDTPGFDHSSLTNEEILRRIAVWLASSYGEGVKVAGVVYIQSIATGRMTESQASGLEIFKKICGEKPFPNVVLATTGWDMYKKPDPPAQREGELRDHFWRSMLSGSQAAAMVRLDRCPNSALEVVKKIIEHTLPSTGTVLLLQHQIVDERKSFLKTDAALLIKPRGESLLERGVSSFKKLIMGMER